MKLSCLKIVYRDGSLPETVKGDPITIEIEFSRSEYFKLIVEK